MNKEEIQAIHKIQLECFGKDDYYSDMGNLLQFFFLESGGYFVHKEDGKVVGYIIFQTTKKKIDGVRSAVTKRYRGKGISSKLYKKMIKLADDLGLPYCTYTSTDNYPSINSHIRCGMRLTKLDDWAHLQYEPR